jgi:hypothetical protein
MRILVLFALLGTLALGAAGGCAKRTEPPFPGKKISLQEYQKMSIEEKADPYVLEHLEKKGK